MVLRKKIILASLVFGLMASVLLIGMFYWLIEDNFRSEFEESKLSLSRALAATIDGDVHRRLAQSRDTADPDYLRHFAAFRALLASDKTITYAYSLYRDPDSGKFVYVFDGGVAEQDKVWFENEFFALEAYLDEQGRVSLDFNGSTLHNDFDLNINGHDYGRIHLASVREGTAVQWKGQTLFSVRNEAPLQVKVDGRVIDHSVRPRLQTVTVDGKDVENSYLLSTKGESTSLPGDPYNDTEESHEKLTQAMQDHAGSLWRADSIYGAALTSSAVIRNAQGEAQGLVLVELFDKTINKKKFLLLSAAIAIPLIIVLLVFTTVVAERVIIRRVKLLDDGVTEIIRRNFRNRLEISGNDELSGLARNFNDMAKEIDGNTAMLESRIEERTRSLSQKTAELIETQQKLVASEKMAALGVFTAGMAHEINNPANFVSAGAQNAEAQLAVFKDFLTALLDDNADAELVAEFDTHFHRLDESMRLIRTGIGRIEAVVKNLRASNPEGEVDRYEADVVQALESAWRMMASSLTFPVHVKESLRDRPLVVCSIAEVQQVFLALLGNACQSIADARALRGQGFEGQITLDAQVENGQLIISVGDNGVGIPTDHLDKIFDPFFTTREVGRGAGLGLSMARDVAHRHAGSLVVESVEGQGAVFTLTLPLRG